MKSIVIPNDLAAAKKLEAQILADLQKRGYCESATFAIKLAFEEAVTNAVRHGNQSDPNKQVRVRYRITAEFAEIEVRDEGPGFQPDAVPDPTLPEYIDRPNGRGLMLMRAYLDEVEYCGCGNIVRMVKFNRELRR